MESVSSETGVIIPVQGFEMLPDRMTVHGEPSFAEWSAMMAQVLHVRGALPWWTGDLLTYGECAYGEAYAQAIEVTGYEYQTLANYASVCRRVPPERRQPELSFSHHALVAALLPEDQTYWLHEAWDLYWTTSDLRDALRDKARQLVAGQVESEPREPQEQIELPERPERATLQMTLEELAALATYLAVLDDDAPAVLKRVAARVNDLYLSQ